MRGISAGQLIGCLLFRLYGEGMASFLHCSDNAGYRNYRRQGYHGLRSAGYLFCFLAFYGVIEDWYNIAAVGYGVKVIVGFSDTAFIYLSKLTTPRDLAVCE
jgi:hypothetical protein